MSEIVRGGATKGVSAEPTLALKQPRAAAASHAIAKAPRRATCDPSAMQRTLSRSGESIGVYLRFRPGSLFRLTSPFRLSSATIGSIFGMCSATATSYPAALRCQKEVPAF